MTDSLSSIVEFVGDWDQQIVATSIHAGHDVRPELAELMVLPEADRTREEDPHTDRLAEVAPARVVTHRSRFETDLNRPRREAVYRKPDDCWGLEVWKGGELPDGPYQRSLETYDAFYDALAERLDEVAARGPFVVLDVHSYNHRRYGKNAPPADPKDNPLVNVGTASVEDDVFEPLVQRFMRDIRSERIDDAPVDARTNVAFEGRNLAWFVHDRYPRVGCVLALEFKKTFMDEWTGEVDEEQLAESVDALAATLPGLRESLDALG